MPLSVEAFLRRLSHDLTRRLLWAARDCRDFGREPEPGELTVTLVGPSGEPETPHQTWERLKREAPPGLDLSEFEVSLMASLAAVLRGDVDGVLALEPALVRLRRAAGIKFE